MATQQERPASISSAGAAMPTDWVAKAAQGARAGAVADYIAGMTDRFAIAEHGRLFDGASDLR